METLKMPENTISRSMEQERLPFSILAIWLRSVLAFSAKTSWVIPLDTLSCWSRSPNTFWSKYMIKSFPLARSGKNGDEKRSRMMVTVYPNTANKSLVKDSCFHAA